MKWPLDNAIIIFVYPSESLFVKREMMSRDEWAGWVQFGLMLSVAWLRNCTHYDDHQRRFLWKNPHRIPAELFIKDFDQSWVLFCLKCEHQREIKIAVKPHCIAAGLLVSLSMRISLKFIINICNICCIHHDDSPYVATKLTRTLDVGRRASECMMGKLHVAIFQLIINIFPSSITHWMHVWFHFANIQHESSCKKALLSRD